MTTLTTSALSTEVLESALLTLEQISTRITVLAVNASRNPVQLPGVRMLLGDLLADIQTAAFSRAVISQCPKIW